MADRPDPAVLTATVDQLQAELDRLSREVIYIYLCIIALATLAVFYTWNEWHQT